MQKEPSQRPTVSRTLTAITNQCEVCKQAAIVLVLIEPYAYVCPECLELSRSTASGKLTDDGRR